jgi:plastocyanin
MHGSMRKFLVLAGVVIATAATTVAVAVAGGSAVVDATITSGGITPASVRVAQFDSVRWVNNDSISHSIVFSSADGVVCAQPLVLAAGANGSCQITKAGKYSYSDPTVKKGNKFHGTIDVAAAPVSLTFAAAPLQVTYLGRTTVSGVLSSQAAGETVTGLAQACGQSSASKFGTVTTTAGGAFALVVQPAMNTSYAATYRNVNSPTTQVNVRPRIALAKLALRKYRVRVTAAQSFKGRYVAFQRYNASTLRWVFVKSVVLRVVTPITGALAGTTTTSSTFLASQKHGLKLRVVMSKTQVGSCYTAGSSNSITN